MAIITWAVKPAVGQPPACSVPPPGSTQPAPSWPPSSCLPLSPYAAPVEKKAAPQPESAAPATEQTPQAPEPEEQFASTTTPTTALSAPNMIGNLLGAGRSVSFFVNRVQGADFINSVGSTNIVNPKVADNNSPLPQDRISFRYNFFDDALSVTGASPAPPVFDPVLGAFRGTTTTKNYEVDQYTFSWEQTFFDRRFSVETRLPFSRTLASHLDLSYGHVTGIGQATDLQGNPLEPPQQALEVASTPLASLGSQDTELGNMSVILKGLVCQNSWFAFSTGLAVGIPTGQDTNVRVTDYLGPPEFNNASIQRVRDFHISNDTVALSPFLAVLATPTNRFFAQAFVQWDIPLNSSNVSFTETAPFVLNGPFPGTPGPGMLIPPFSANTSIEEQALLHTDVGIGYWLVRRPEARWLTGLAPTLEMHYTTTLENADIVTLPGDTAKQIVPVQIPGVMQPVVVQVPEPPPQVGNLRNRVDILDLTVGTTFEFGRRATLATAFSFPTRGVDNRTFDWEFQVQLNIYFGGPSRGTPAPNF
jgi:hypothetical protein